jgi:hypothetical protein
LQKSILAIFEYELSLITGLILCIFAYIFYLLI